MPPPEPKLACTPLDLLVIGPALASDPFEGGSMLLKVKVHVQQPQMISVTGAVPAPPNIDVNKTLLQSFNLDNQSKR